MLERVSFTSASGADADGVIARPAGDAPVPAVVLLQEWWGINEQIQAAARRFADAGFLTLVPDLYHGKVAADAAEAGALMKGLDWARAIDEIVGAVRHLREHARCTGKVAISGYCMGGALSLATACRVPGLAAVVPFYGVPGEADYTKIDAPIQAHFAKRDDWATVSAGEAVKAAVIAAGGSMELHVYDADHAFCNERRPEVYSAEAAALSWTRTLEFLRAHT